MERFRLPQGWMKPTGRPATKAQPEDIDFVPKREFDRAQQENDRLRKQIERLQRETERLRRELEAALRASKRQATPHSRGNPKPIRSDRAGNRAAITAARHVAPPHRGWMNASRFPCRITVRIAAGAWSRKAAKRSIRKRLSGGRLCAVSKSPWAIAANARSGCR